MAYDDVVELAGTANTNADVTVYALSTEQPDSDWTDAQPAGTAAPGEGQWRLSVPRVDRNHDRAYDKFVVTTVVSGTTTVLGPSRYPTPEFAATNDYPFPDGASKKGLGVQMTDDAEELGASHTGVNIVVNRIMQLHAEPGNTIPFESEGVEYYFSASEVSRLDRHVKSMSDNGMVVSAILLLQNRSDSDNAPTRQLIHPDAARGHGVIYAFNTKTAEGVRYVRAASEFLAQRYSAIDQAHGRIAGYIVGNEVDAHWVWQNMGEKTLPEFMDYYTRALRIVHTANRKAYQNARTYISLTGGWNNPQAETDPHFFTGRTVIDELGRLSRRHGDFGWHVAHHAYPENLYDPRFWEDTNVTTDPMSTHVVNFKNLEVLTDYLRRDDLLFEGRARRVILSEQGFHTVTDLPVEDAEKLQAAAYALAYYRVRFSEGVDGFHLHRHVDWKGEGAPEFHFGVWTYDATRPEPNAPGRPKFLHHVLADIDTDRSLAVTEFAKPIIGIDTWESVVPGFDPSALAQRKRTRRVEVTVGRTPVRPIPIADFDSGTHGWRVSDNATVVRPSDGALSVEFAAETFLWRGTDVVFTKSVDVRRTHYLNLRVVLPRESTEGVDPGASFEAKVKVYAADGSVAAGIAALTPGETTSIGMNLASWPGRKAVTRIKVWARGSTSDDWAGNFLLRDICWSPAIRPR